MIRVSFEQGLIRYGTKWIYLTRVFDIGKPDNHPADLGTAAIGKSAVESLLKIFIS